MRLRFEELLTDPRAVVTTLSAFLGQPFPDVLLDVRRTPQGASPTSRSTAINLRTGTMGDHANHMTATLARRLDNLSHEAALKAGSGT